MRVEKLAVKSLYVFTQNAKLHFTNVIQGNSTLLLTKAKDSNTGNCALAEKQKRCWYVYQKIILQEDQVPARLYQDPSELKRGQG